MLKVSFNIATLHSEKFDEDTNPMYNMSQIYSIYSTSAFKLSNIFRWRNIVVDGNLKLIWQIVRLEISVQKKCASKLMKHNQGSSLKDAAIVEYEKE